MGIKGTSMQCKRVQQFLEVDWKTLEMGSGGSFAASSNKREARSRKIVHQIF